MENVAKEVNSFSRNLYNLSKKGAYYTPTEIVKRISYLFAFPKGEFNALDPTCGDGEALLAAVEGTKARTYGCEVDSEVAKATDEKFRSRGTGLVVEADFYRGLKSTYNVFDFIFTNPPYIKDEDGERLESKTIKKLYGLTKKGAYVAAVVPFGIVSDENRKIFLTPWVERWETVGFYRFDDKDYEAFKQVVLIGKKRQQLLSTPLMILPEDTTLEGEVERLYGLLKEIEKWPYLPKSREEIPEEQRFVIKESKSSGIKYFTTTEFDVRNARQTLRSGSPLYAKLGEKLENEEYAPLAVGQPPIPLKKDHMYLCAVSGAGTGLCGSAEEGTLHLQRGFTKRAESEEMQKGEESGSKGHIVVTSYIKTGLNIVQADGTITELA